MYKDPKKQLDYEERAFQRVHDSRAVAALLLHQMADAINEMDDETFDLGFYTMALSRLSEKCKYALDIETDYRLERWVMPGTPMLRIPEE